MNISDQFFNALRELEKQLYKQSLYAEGLIMINYDRIDKEFKICEQPDKNSISMDEYPNKNNYYFPEQKRVIVIDIEQLYEAYRDCLRENDIEQVNNRNEKTKDIWESIVDNTIEIAQEQQMYSNIDDIIDRFENNGDE